MKNCFASHAHLFSKEEMADLLTAVKANTDAGMASDLAGEKAVEAALVEARSDLKEVVDEIQKGRLDTRALDQAKSEAAHHLEMAYGLVRRAMADSAPIEPQPAPASTRRKGSEFLQHIKKAGGIDPKEAADLMGDSAMMLNRRLPGVSRKGGMSGDALLEWSIDNGYLLRHDAEEADANQPGGAIELAYGLVRRALADEEVVPVRDEHQALARRLEEERNRQEEQWIEREAQSAVDEASPDWSTMTDEEKDAELDRIFAKAVRADTTGGEEVARAGEATPRPEVPAETGRPALELAAPTEAEVKAKEAQAATGKVEEKAAALRDRNEAILTPPAGTAPPASAAEQNVPTQQQGLNLPPRTADTMSEAIALSSPNGRMSGRARDAANERLSTALFGEGGLQRPETPQPTEREQLLRQAQELRGLADRGMNKKAHLREAERLEAEAAKLDGSFSRSRAPLGPFGESIRREIDPVLKKWPNAPAVHVIASMAEAPQAMRLMDNAMRSSGATGTPEAFIYQNEVYLVADGLAPGRVFPALFHESLGHFGLRGTFSDRLDPILDRVAFDFRDRVAAKAKEYGLDVSDVGDRRMAAEEVLAELAQNRPQLGIVRRLVAAIRQFLRDIGIDLKLTDEDVIANFIAPARAFVERGRAQSAGVESPAFSRAAPIPPWVQAQPAQTREALRKAGIWHQPPTLKARVAEWSRDWQQRVRQGLVDQFDPIKNYDYKAYMHARMTKGADAALEGVLMNGTIYLDQDGAVDVKYEKGGFLGILSKLNNEHDRFFAWVIGNRAERLMAEGREHNFTADDIARLKALNQGQMKGGQSRSAAYEIALNSLNRYNRSLLDMAEKAGLIDPESRSVWEKDFYIPFYRLMEEERVKGPVRSKGLVRQYAFKTLKGGAQAIGDPLENVLRNWSHLIDASLKNQAAKESVLAAANVGAAVEAPEAEAREMAKSAGKKDAVVFFLDQGVPRHFVIDDPFLLDAIQSIGFSGFQGAGMKIMGKVKRWLTFGVTVSPTFRIRNIIRDSLTMIGTNPASYNVLDNIVTGWKMTKEGDPLYASLIAGGGVMRYGTALEGDRAEHVKRMIEAGIKDDTVLDTPEKVKEMLTQAWDWWMHVGDRSENLNRAALYSTLRKQGKSHLEASYAARDTMDFSMQGTWAAIRFLGQTVPFFNARLQGLYKLGRGAQEDPQRFAYVVGGAALASIALLLAYKDDDDWKQREDYDRDTYWWFKVGDKAFRIPKPFEIGAIGTLAERAMEAMITDQLTGKQFAERVGSILSQQLSMNPIPQLVKPMIEAWANKDFFTDRPIESSGMEKLSRAERIAPGTSATAQLAGKAGLISPVQIDHLVNGYFGWLGTHVVATADLAVRPAMGLKGKPAARIDEVLVAGDFVKDLPAYQSKYVTHLYDQAKRVQESLADYRHALQLGDREKAAAIYTNEAENIRLARLYTASEAQLSKVNSQIRIVQQSPEDSDTKRLKLDRLYAMRNSIAKFTDEKAKALRQ